MKKKISIIIPAYNEQDNLPHAFARLNALFTNQLAGYELEAIILDNSSSDKTEEIASAFALQDNRWKYVRYSRNFGADVSMTAGLDFATGDAVVNLFRIFRIRPKPFPSL